MSQAYGAATTSSAASAWLPDSVGRNQRHCLRHVFAMKDNVFAYVFAVTFNQVIIYIVDQLYSTSALFEASPTARPVQSRRNLYLNRPERPT